jgi:hypothetical protein
VWVDVIDMPGLSRASRLDIMTGLQRQADRKGQMLRRIWFLFLGAGLLSSVAKAEESRVGVQLSGIGTLTCAHWRSSAATRAEGTVWILGFWSGLNYVAAASEQSQPNVNEKQVISEVVKLCASDPSQILASATWAAYINASGK